ncbi:sensor kinase SpoOB-type protein [Tumebacillus sp. BK434]|nr:sensor kinase SpoOB-type protein [Tumebacillus sp. BK434]
MNHNLPSEQTNVLEIRRLMADSLDVLRTYRHDLMNQVQLLHAYSQMKKFDRLQEPIQNLIAEAQRHTEMSAIASPMISYVVLTRDICYQMLHLHASYEQLETPSLQAEQRAAEVLFDLLDHVGKHSMTLLEPLRMDVWIVAFGQGYEIGWFLGGSGDGEPDFAAWAQRWAAQGIQFQQLQEEDGIEYSIRFQAQE